VCEGAWGFLRASTSSTTPHPPPTHHILSLLSSSLAVDHTLTSPPHILSPLLILTHPYPPHLKVRWLAISDEIEDYRNLYASHKAIVDKVLQTYPSRMDGSGGGGAAALAPSAAALSAAGGGAAAGGGPPPIERLESSASIKLQRSGTLWALNHLGGSSAVELSRALITHNARTAQCVHSALSMPLTAAAHCVCVLQPAAALQLGSMEDESVISLYDNSAAARQLLSARFQVYSTQRELSHTQCPHPSRTATTIATLCQRCHSLTFSAVLSLRTAMCHSLTFSAVLCNATL